MNPSPQTAHRETWRSLPADQQPAWPDGELLREVTDGLRGRTAAGVRRGVRPAARPARRRRPRRGVPAPGRRLRRRRRPVVAGRPARPGQHQRPVDLVGDHAGAVPRQRVADSASSSVAREHPAERVVRLGEQQRAGAGRERVRRAGRGRAPRARRPGRLDQVDPLATGDRGDVAERRVAGGSGITIGPGGQSTSRASRMPAITSPVGPPRRVDATTPVPRREAGVRRAHPAVAERRVAGHAAAHRSRERRRRPAAPGRSPSRPPRPAARRARPSPTSPAAPARPPRR